MGPIAKRMEVKRLTQRQRDVWRLIAQGLTGKEIAAVLGVAVSTVESYRVQLCRRLGVTKQTELVLDAVRFGIVHVEVEK